MTAFLLLPILIGLVFGFIALDGQGVGGEALIILK